MHISGGQCPLHPDVDAEANDLPGVVGRAHGRGAVECTATHAFGEELRAAEIVIQVFRFHAERGVERERDAEGGERDGGVAEAGEKRVNQGMRKLMQPRRDD